MYIHVYLYIYIIGIKNLQPNNTNVKLLQCYDISS